MRVVILFSVCHCVQTTDPPGRVGGLCCPNARRSSLALQGTVLGVCGSTGSGKSSLLSAILGEVSDP